MVDHRSIAGGSRVPLGAGDQVVATARTVAAVERLAEEAPARALALQLGRQSPRRGVGYEQHVSGSVGRPGAGVPTTRTDGRVRTSGRPPVSRRALVARRVTGRKSVDRSERSLPREDARADREAGAAGGRTRSRGPEEAGNGRTCLDTGSHPPYSSIDVFKPIEMWLSLRGRRSRMVVLRPEDRSGRHDDYGAGDARLPNDRNELRRAYRVPSRRQPFHQPAGRAGRSSAFESNQVHRVRGAE